MPLPDRSPSADCLQCATRAVCVLAPLDAPTLEAIQADIHKRSIARGQRLAEEGRVEQCVRVVKVGSVFGLRRGIDGVTRPIGFAGRGAVFGLSGLFEQPSQTSAISAGPGRVCEIPYESLREAIRREPSFQQYVAVAAASACGRIAAWSEAMRLRGAVNQLAYALLLASEMQSNPVIDLPSHTALADLLGTTRETIARGLGTLEQEGGIRRMERKKCEVYRKPLLARVKAAM